MIDHVTIGVSDLERSRAFYRAALAPLGYTESSQPSAVPDEIEFGGDGRLPFAISTTPTVAPHMHVAFVARTREQVHAFHAAALAAGATDHGAPGLRPEYSEHYYGAFVYDPDGYNIEAVCKTPSQPQG